MAVIKKVSQVLVSTIANGEALGTAIKIEGCERGHVIMPSAWTDADLGFKVCDTQDGTFVILHDLNGVVVDIEDITTDASLAYELPSDIFAGTIWVKPWSKDTTPATETDNNQGAARTLKFVVI